MFKKIFLLGLVTILNASTFSQDVEIDWGSPFESKTEVNKILGFHDGVMYAFSTKGRKTYIEGYSEENFKEKFSKEFKLERKRDFLDVVMTNEGPIAITYEINKRNKTVDVYAKKFKSNGDISGKEKIILEAADNVKLKNQKVIIKVSKDRSKFIIVYSRQERKDDETLHVDFVVVDKSMKVLSENTFKQDISTFAERGGYVNISYNVEIDNQGGYLYSLSKFSARKKQTAKYSLTLYEFDNEGKGINTKTIVTKGKGVLSPKVYIDEENNKINLVGFYFDNEERGKLFSTIGYQGVFNAVLERGSLKEISNSTVPFPEDFLKRIYNKRRVEKAQEKGEDLEIPLSYEIDYMKINDKGDLFISAESYTYQVAQSSGATSHTYVFGDVIVMKITKSGELAWINTIKKTQIATKVNPNIGFATAAAGGIVAVGATFGKNKPKEYSNYSYIAAITDDNFTLLYNDHYKLSTKEEDDRKALRNPKKSIPYQYTFNNKSGDGTKKNLVGESDADGTYLAPKVHYKVSETEFIVWARFKKENKFGRVVFK